MAKRTIFIILLGILTISVGYPCSGSSIDSLKKEIITQPEPDPPYLTLRERVVETYRSFIGVRELTGKNDGPEVEMFLRATGLGKGFAWCAAFVAFVFLEHNVIIPKGAAWSPSWFPQDKIINKEEGLEGDVFGIHFIRLGRIAHVGFLDEEWDDKGNTILTVEGNTNSDGDREGDGVHRKRRSKKQIKSISRWL